MRRRKTILSLAILLLMLADLPAGAAGLPSGATQFEVIRQAAEKYVSRKKPAEILAKDLHALMLAGTPYGDVKYYNPTLFKGPWIIDVRTSESGELPDPYYSGHIPGAVNVPWRQIADFQILRSLPRDRPIVVYSDTGLLGAQVTALLNVLGFDARNLKWGMTSWTADPQYAPGRYEAQRDAVWTASGSYRAICPLKEPTKIYPLPVVANTKSGNRQTILEAAARTSLKAGKPAHMAAPYLHHLLYAELDPLQGSPADRWNEQNFNVPFFLDVRNDELYENGHLCGTAHYQPKDLFKKANLRHLPPAGQILVYDQNGHLGGEITALLNLLGYDAVNLKWGISGWTLSLPGADVAPDRYVEDRDCIKIGAIVKGFAPSAPCPA
ncbi:MAG: rhodanese-like domain-containing protein [Deltaproteobacteria bacterium]|nr:rhodanese-like domain-containing protein [Deltaproteobacteria bacterium]